MACAHIESDILPEDSVHTLRSSEVIDKRDMVSSTTIDGLTSLTGNPECGRTDAIKR